MTSSGVYLLICLQTVKKSQAGCEELYGDSIFMSRTLDPTLSLRIIPSMCLFPFPSCFQDTCMAGFLGMRPTE